MTDETYFEPPEGYYITAAESRVRAKFSAMLDFFDNKNLSIEQDMLCYILLHKCFQHLTGLEISQIGEVEKIDKEFLGLIKLYKPYLEKMDQLLDSMSIIVFYAKDGCDFKDIDGSEKPFIG